MSERYFPKRDPRAGGPIYIWTLGANKTAHLIAREFGHDALFEFVMARSPLGLQLAVACQLGDEPMVRTLSSGVVNLPDALTPDDRERLVAAAFDNDAKAVRLMLAVGWPVDVSRSGGDTALHWAAWHGNPEMTRNLLDRRASVDSRDLHYQGTPLNWALHGSVHGWHPERGDYPGTVEALLDAGAANPAITPGLVASDAVRALLIRRSDRDSRKPSS